MAVGLDHTVQDPIALVHLGLMDLVHMARVLMALVHMAQAHMLLVLILVSALIPLRRPHPLRLPIVAVAA